MEIIPLTLKEANAFIEKLHRHHKPVQGHRFSIAAKHQGEVIGVAICGRPVSREVNFTEVLEVTRLCTDGTKNACSFLYSACARIAKEMGFKKIQTYILDTEPGVSLKAVGWVFESMTAGGDWNHSKKYAGKRRTDQPMNPKQRWARIL